MTEVETELDVKGLACPLPLLKAKQALKALASGDKLRVYATDAGSWRDFQVFSEKSGHLLIERSEELGVYSYLLQKNSICGCGCEGRIVAKNDNCELQLLEIVC